MLLRIAALLLLMAVGTPAGAAQNRLGGHPSPYLALHGEDPVHWQAWGRGALERAREQGRLVLVSSGYFACHWCHVMQRESYRDPELAAFLNAHFVAVKVDRELRPALDAYLVDFVERTRGRAGWPLNVFLTPAGHPLLGVTYLPRDEFLGLLRRLQKRWRDEPEALESAAELAAASRRAAAPAAAPELTRSSATDLRRALVHHALELGDELAGGFGNVSKFPMAPQLLALLQVLEQERHQGLEALLRLTLERMACAALHDHLGGGFFRYTVDPGWQTPHFEKMLYDNALLARVYLRAARVLDQPRYRRVARRTLDFMLEQLGTSQGAFIASLSAVDAQGTEGGHYLYADAELEQVLSEQELRAARLAWGMDQPAFEAGHLPVPALEPERIAQRLGIDGERVQALLDSARDGLLELRSKRSLPRDTKVLAGWNGLALLALTDAAALEDGRRYARAAARLAAYLQDRLWDGDALHRHVAAGVAVGEASLQDYAYVALGLLAWSGHSGDPRAQSTAAAIARQAWRRFHSEQGWRLAESPLIPYAAAEPALADGPMPSPSAVILDASLTLASANGDGALATRARHALRQAMPVLQDSPFWYASHVPVLARAASGLETAP